MHDSNWLAQQPWPADSLADQERKLSALLMAPRPTRRMHVPQPASDVVPLPPTAHAGVPGQSPDRPDDPPPVPPPEMLPEMLTEVPPKVPPGMPLKVPPDPMPQEIIDPVLPAENSPVRDPLGSQPSLPPGRLWSSGRAKSPAEHGGDLGGRRPVGPAPQKPAPDRHCGWQADRTNTRRIPELCGT